MRPGERTVTLVDGRQVSNYSEDHRHECEARHILRLPTLAQRRAHLYGVQESVKRQGKWLMVWSSKGIQQLRGEAEVKRLEATMIALWRARQAVAK